MAEPIVGQSIQKPMEPTNVPGAPQVSKEVVAADLSAPQSAAPQPQAPAGPLQGYQDVSGMDMQDVPQGYQEIDNKVVVEDTPSYANGATPETAVNSSPLDVLDRLKLSAGNKVGKLRFLKSKFEDAQIDPSGDFKVRKDGVWYNVDPSNGAAQDAWNLSRTIASKILPPVLGNLFAPDKATQDEVLKDIADVAPEIASTALSAAGALGGAALAGPVGAAGGATAGGAAAAGLRTSLGRLAGTYEATPEEQAKDIGWEALLSLGGETVALGAKPTLQLLGKALSKVSSSASTYSKELISAAAEGLTNNPRWTFRRAIDDPNAVIGKAQQAIKALPEGASPQEAVGIIKGKQNRIVTELANESDAALKSNYRQNLGQIVASTPDSFVVKPKEAIEQAMLDLQEQGFGQVSKEGAFPKFELLSADALSRMLMAPKEQLPKILGPETKKGLQNMADILNQYVKIPSISGKAGAVKAVELRRALRESFDELTSSDAPGQIKNLVAQVKKGIDEKIAQSFSDAGNIDTYLKLNTEYSRYADAVKMLKKAVNSKNPQEIENLTQKLASKSGAYRQLKEETGDLANLLGHDKVQSLVDWEAAKSFTDYIPKSIGGSGSSTLFGSTLKAAGSSIANPRLIGSEIKYGVKTLDFLKSLGPKQLNELLKNDQALTHVLTYGGQLGAREEGDTVELLKQAGIADGSGGQENQ